jgi:hypothetical protein
MAKIVVSEFVSLDGVMEALGGEPGRFRYHLASTSYSTFETPHGAGFGPAPTNCPPPLRRSSPTAVPSLASVGLRSRETKC